MKHKLYIVVGVNLVNQKSRLGAYFSEENARYAAGRLVGRKQGQSISLETIDVLDDLPKDPAQEMGQKQRV
jgi:hypothetical protein